MFKFEQALEHLDSDQLKSALDLVNKKIATSAIEDKIKIDKIVEGVKNNGYYCSSDYKSEISGLNRISLPYYVTVRSDDSNMFIYEPLEIQRDWVYALGCECWINKYTKFKLMSKWSKWNHSVYGYASYSARVFITVYHPPRECPADGENFQIIDENGRIEDMYIRGEMIIWADGQICKNLWKDSGFFIRPDVKV